MLRAVAILAFGLIMTVASCTTTGRKTDPAGETRKSTGFKKIPPAKLPPPDRIDSRGYNIFVSAILMEQIGNLRVAADQYNKALEYFPESYVIRLSYARVLFTMEQYFEALTVLAPIYPEDVPVYELRGSCYRSVGEDDSARASFLQLVGLDDNNSMAYSYLAGDYRRFRNLDSLIWAYQNLTRIRPDNYRLLGELAKLQAQKGNVEVAKQSFRKSIEANSSLHNTLAFTGLGELYQLTGDLDSAMTVFKQGLLADPNSVLLNRIVVSQYWQSDSLAKALPYALRLAKLSPLDRAESRRVGIIYYGLDSLDLADSVLQAIVESGENNWVNHFYLGRIALRRDSLKTALFHFSRVTQQADTLAQSWLDLGRVYRLMKRPQAEIDSYKTGLDRIRSTEAGVPLMFALGAAYEQNNQFDRAKTAFEETIALAPDHSQALNYLGYMLADRGVQLHYARELIEKAIAQSPNNAAFLDSYGWVFYRLGDYDQALTFLSRAAALDIDPVILDHLGDTHAALGEMEEARKWWSKALNLTPDNPEIKEKLEH